MKQNPNMLDVLAAAGETMAQPSVRAWLESQPEADAIRYAGDVFTAAVAAHKQLTENCDALARVAVALAEQHATLFDPKSKKLLVLTFPQSLPTDTMKQLRCAVAARVGEEVANSILIVAGAAASKKLRKVDHA